MFPTKSTLYFYKLNSLGTKHTFSHFLFNVCYCKLSKSSLKKNAKLSFADLKFSVKEMTFIDGQKGKLLLNRILQRILLNGILNSILKYLATYLTSIFEFLICVLNWQCPKLNSFPALTETAHSTFSVNKWQFQSSHYSDQNPEIFLDSSLFLTCHIKSASSVDTSLNIY